MTLAFLGSCVCQEKSDRQEPEMGWDGHERRKTRRLTDDEKREIYEAVQGIFEQRIGRGTISTIRKACWTVCVAGFGYLLHYAEKWFK
jgi:hypothetical protein